MNRPLTTPTRLPACVWACLLALTALPALAADAGSSHRPARPGPVDVHVPPVSTDPSVKYDYDIVYVRAPRHGEEAHTKWAEFSDPTRMEPGADLMLLHPDGSEEKLVDGRDGSVMDPYVSFDAQWVYYAKFIDARHSGSDIYKIHIPTRKVVRLTDQTFAPNTGAADWSADFRTPGNGKTALSYGVYNLGPCPAPGGRVVFTSNRNAFTPPRGYPKITLQLFAMDDDGANVDQIGHLNVACALHPTILADGRVLFSSLESEGLHNAILWGIWSIHPDGTYWEPIVSAFWPGGAPPGFHFEAQLSDRSLVVEQYYNLNNSGFGSFLKLPLHPPAGEPAFGPGWLDDPRNSRQRYGNRYFQMPFTPTGMEVLTPFASSADEPAPTYVPGEQLKAWQRGKPDRPTYPNAAGKVTHPSGAPDNNLLCVWSPGPAHNGEWHPFFDSGIYLLKDGQPVDEPAQMRLIKNDPNYNEQWPRALVPYKRIYGIDEPQRLPHRNDGTASPELPEGTPFGLIGTASLYKRESATGGRVPAGSVTAVGDDKRQELGWWLQGSDAGFYDNADIHAIRILVQEPRTDITGNKGAPRYGSHGNERLRILGEIPVRKFDKAGHQPLDPDGNPDTSFLAKVPADQPFTFQLLDKSGMVLATAQTWHQLRPGEIRNDCGGCHAHSQKPTDFRLTAAARPDYKVFDLTASTPLLTTRDRAEGETSRRQWDERNETGLRYEKHLLNVEYHRDIRPIFQRQCVACHTQKADKPAGGLVLDDDDKTFHGSLATSDTIPSFSALPGPYHRLAGAIENRIQASRYIVKYQSRKSLLAWKVFGRRTDGLSNDDFPSETIPGDPTSLRSKGERIKKLDYSDVGTLQRYLRDFGDIDYTGTAMPPPEAVAGTYKAPDGRTIQVPPLSDEDKRTIARWIDLGCPIDLDYDPAHPDRRGYGWMCDDQRPTLTVTYPQPGENGVLSRILIGACDAYSGLDEQTLSVKADFAIDGIPAGQELFGRFKSRTPGVWEWRPGKPVDALKRGTLTVSVKDKQGNVARVVRTFSVATATARGG